METINGFPIPETTRGVLYICTFSQIHENNYELRVNRTLLFEDPYDALEAYTNIPNPESQLAAGETYQELCTNLMDLHEQMVSQEYLKALSESL